MNRTRKIAAAAFAVTAAGGAGVAFAAWTSPNGTGNAYAKSDQAIAVTANNVSGNAFSGELLYPGVSGKKVYAVVTNPNPYPVLVTFSQNAPITSTTGPAACDAATGVTYTPAGAIAVAANAVDFEVQAGTAAMSNASDTSCQDKLFAIPVTVASVSNAS